MSNKQHEGFEPIAVVGVGAIFPGACDAEQFWRNVIEGKDLITLVPPTHWLIDDYYDSDPKAIDKTYCKRGAFIPDVEFDPMEYGIPPNNLAAIDTSQLLALVVAKQVLDDAVGVACHGVDLSRVSVILGSAPLEALQYMSGRMQRPVWTRALREAGLPESLVQKVCDRISGSFPSWQENTFPGLLSNVISGRIANRFNLGGTNCTTDAACASSLAALSMAVSELHLNTSDMVITGGVDTLNDIIMYMCFSKTQALSLSGDCRPFSDKADGTVIGEGLGMIALKRLTDAEKNRDKIYAVIRGVGTSSDGRSKSIYAPSAQGQSKAILRAYRAAGFDPHTIELIEAHGTGTQAGDAAEFAGLQLAFSEDTSHPLSFCALGSIKSQIGHTKSAAGAAGMLKAIMALHHKILPPTLKVDNPNPELGVANSAFYLNTELRPWIKNSQHPRRAGVSSFGFGGSNYHVALEEYTGNYKPYRLRTAPTELIILAADNPQALVKVCENYLDYKDESLSYVARLSQENYEPSKLARLAIIANSSEDLHEKLKRAVAAIQQGPQQSLLLSKDIYYGYAINPGRVAFLFPGQGSQYLKMGINIATAFDQTMSLWELAAKTLSFNEKSLHHVIFPRPAFEEEICKQQKEKLNATQWAQPALAVTSLAYLRLLKDLQIYSDSVAGHSFGELTALCAADVIDEPTLLLMAKKRGELMQETSGAPGGAMTSVAHPVDEVLDRVKQAKLRVTPANFNSPNQVVLSGTLEDIEEAEDYFQKQNIKYHRLPVSNAFHSKQVETCSQSFHEFLKTISFSAPKVPVFSNTTAEPYPDKSKVVPGYLAKQMTEPVRFQKLIENMYQNGVRTFIEVGPHTVLSGLVNQCLAAKDYHAIPLDCKSEHGITSLWHGLGKLFVVGLNPTFASLWRDYRPAEKSEKKQKNHCVKLNGTNYARPYPPVGGSEHLPKPNPEQSFVAQHDQSVFNSIPKNTLGITNSETINRGKTMTQSNNTHFVPINQELQRQLIEVHHSYQKTMAEAHIAFLNSISHLSQQAVPGSGMVPVTLQPMPIAAKATPIVQSVAPPVFAATITTMAPLAPPPPATTQAFQNNVAPPVVQPIILPEPKSKGPSQQNNSSSSAHDLKDLLLKIIEEKTGYPCEMLNMEMAIESDLGIDSIKRVEIFSALHEKFPHFPEVDSGQLAEMHTLNDILGYIKKYQVAHA